jgi:4-hydroxybenzoate polyprenyltransferase
MLPRTFASIGRLHIVAIAGVGTLTFGWLMTGTRPWLLAAVVCVDWFIVNLLNRAVDLREDLANQIPGSEVVAKHRKGVLGMGGLLLAGTLVAVHLVAPAVTPLRVAYHLLGAAYNWPLLPGRVRLKTVYLAKNLASAAGFMITLFGYPLAQLHATGGQWAAGFGPLQLAVAATFFFLFEVSWEIVYDMRDAPGDKLAGVHTLAVVHGVDGAARVADGLLLGSAMVLLIGYFWLALPWRVVVMVVAPALQWVLYRRWLKRGLTSAHVVALTWTGAGLLIVYHLWIALNLPGVRAAPWS